MKKRFEVVLSIWQAEGDVDLNKPELTNQIKEGENGYNHRFSGFKVIKVTNITKRTIVLELTVIIASADVKVEVSRSITYFSQFMYHRMGWAVMSKVKKRLFTVIESTEKPITEIETSGEINEGKSISGIEDNSMEIEDVDMDMDRDKDIDLKRARLELLYATIKFAEIEIRLLESTGIKINN